jgi:hypothetical protein
MRTRVLALLVSLLATPALGSEGVLEINQTCAVQTGCFAGDSAGFPVTISQPGSYRLTSSLVRSNINLDGILVTSSDVTIDLGGFTIDGGCDPSVCSSGIGRGILVLGGRKEVRIRDGIIKHNAREGIKAADAGAGGIVVEDLSITANVGVGVWLGPTSIVEDVVAIGNGGNGINVGDHGAVTRSRAVQNAGHGILTGVGSNVNDSTASLNGGRGIEALSSGVSISGNSIYQNFGGGINVGRGATVAGNTVESNSLYGITASLGSNISANTLDGNQSFGVVAGGGATVQGNSVRSHSMGLNLSATAAYRDNTISESPDAVLGGINAGGNVCNGSLTCP